MYCHYQKTALQQHHASKRNNSVAQYVVSRYLRIDDRHRDEDDDPAIDLRRRHAMELRVSVIMSHEYHPDDAARKAVGDFVEDPMTYRVLVLLRGHHRERMY